MSTCTNQSSYPFGYFNERNIFEGANTNIMMMTLIPLITSILSNTVTETIKGAINVASLMFYTIVSIMRRNVLTRYTGYHKVYIGIKLDSVTQEVINKEAVPLMWYFNNIIRYISTKHSVLMCNGPMQKWKQNNIDNNYCLVPMIDQEFVQISNETNTSAKSKNNLQKDLSDIHLGDNIYMSVINIDLTPDIYKRLSMYTSFDGFLIIKSKTKTIGDIMKCINNIQIQYDKYTDQTKKISMYIYRNSLTNMINLPLDRYQSFDNIFMGYKHTILKDINIFNDIDYHIKYGIKRKLGYIFTGARGSGKTCMVTAMAKYLNRTIIYIPISRIHTNKELEDIIHTNIYNTVNYKLDQIIFLFDEIDTICNNSLLKKSADDIKKNESNTSTTVTPSIVINNQKDAKGGSVVPIVHNDDNLNIGILLNILDGNTDQDGLIVVATANDVSKLDTALYRDGRLKHIEFEYMDRDDIAEMVEFYFDTQLSPDQKNSIRNDKVIQSMKLKNICIQKKHSDLSVEEVLTCINMLN